MVLSLDPLFAPYAHPLSIQPNIDSIVTGPESPEQNFPLKTLSESKV